MKKIKYHGCNNVVDLAAMGCYDNYSYSDTKILDCGERLRLHDLNDIKCGSLWNRLFVLNGFIFEAVSFWHSFFLIHRFIFIFIHKEDNYGNESSSYQHYY